MPALVELVEVETVLLVVTSLVMVKDVTLMDSAVKQDPEMMAYFVMVGAAVDHFNISLEEMEDREL